MKLFLHISRDEQRGRFQKRLDDPEKHWKWSSGDLETRAKWADYRAAYTDALARCSTDRGALVRRPGRQKWYRDLAAAEILVADGARRWTRSGRSRRRTSPKVVIPE